jgi:hypothetical protein
VVDPDAISPTPSSRTIVTPAESRVIVTPAAPPRVVVTPAESRSQEV